jgi:hypothetical protein
MPPDGTPAVYTIEEIQLYASFEDARNAENVALAVKYDTTDIIWWIVDINMVQWEIRYGDRKSVRVSVFRQTERGLWFCWNPVA